MKTAILGAGALGTIFAAHLADAGEDVVVVTREPRASLLARDGLRVTGLVEKAARVPVFSDPAAANDADLVISALKTYQSPAVIAGLRPRPGALALSVQNGVYKNDELAAVFGAAHVLGATALISGEVLADGAARFTVNERLLVGELAGGTSARAEAVAAMFARAGIRTAASPGIRAVEWAKYAMFVPSFCLAVITRLPTHRFMSHEGSARVVVALTREMAELARAEGIALPEGGGYSAATIARADDAAALAAVLAYGERMRTAAPAHKVSGLQDLERGRPTEVEETVGYAVRRAAALGLDCPALRTCHGLCGAISPPLAQSERSVPTPRTSIS